MVKNSTVIADEDGDHPDWIELYNGTSQSINLAGFALSDDESNPQKWVFPSISISAGDHLLIFCSDKNRTSGPFLHTNFKLSDSDELLLSNSSFILLDEKSISPAPFDVSEGSVLDGSADLAMFYGSTPSASNVDGTFYNRLDASHASGFYAEPFVAIVSGSESHALHYTLNGSVPTINDPVWSGSLQIEDRSNEPNGISEIPTVAPTATGWGAWEAPVETVFKGTVLRIRSFDAGQPTSHPLNLSYFIDPLGDDRYSFSVVSLITDSLNLFDYDTGIYIPGVAHDNDPWGGGVWGTGNYFGEGDEWERRAHVQFLSDGTQLLDQTIGIRIHGAGTRAISQKSLRFYAREKYGEKKMNIEPFADVDKDQFDVLVMRDMGQDLQSGVAQDVLANQLVKNLHQAWISYRPVITFINGEYWGIQNIRERFDKHYLAQFHELNKDSIDLIDSYYGGAPIGDNIAFNTLYDFIDQNDLSVTANYDFVSEKMDISDFIDNTLTRIYLGCYDWPDNNVKIWRARTPESKFRWLLLDNDGCIGDGDYNSLEHATEPNGNGWPNSPESTLFLRRLLENDDFREQFISRMADLLNSDFTPIRTGSILSQLYETYAPEYDEHHRRWQMLEEGKTLELNYKEVLHAIQIRNCHVREHFMNYFSLTEQEFPYNCDSTQLFLTINNVASINGLVVFPNPNDGQYTVLLSDPINSKTTLRMIDMLGREVFSKVLGTHLDPAIDVNTIGLNPGSYSVVIDNAEKSYYGRVVVF